MWCLEHTSTPPPGHVQVEVESLLSIFPDKLSTAVEKLPWNKTATVLSYQLASVPTRVGDGESEPELLVLHLQFHPDYPHKAPPGVTVNRIPSSASQAVAEALQRQLEGEANQLFRLNEDSLGFLLIDKAEELLAQHVDAGVVKPSLHEEMTRRAPEAGVASEGANGVESPPALSDQAARLEMAEAVTAERARIAGLRSDNAKSCTDVVPASIGSKPHGSSTMTQVSSERPVRIEQCGCGQHSECFIATLGGTVVALKEYRINRDSTIPVENCPMVAEVVAVQAEVQAAELAAPPHSNLVRYRGFNFTADSTAITVELAVEYCAMPNLRRQLELHGPFSATAINAGAAGLIAGLSALHSAGIVHRSITARAVLFDASGAARLGFYGSCRDRLDCMVAGTMWRRQSDVGAGRQADRQNLAKTIVTMATGDDSEKAKVSTATYQQLSTQVKQWLDEHLPASIAMAKGEARPDHADAGEPHGEVAVKTLRDTQRNDPPSEFGAGAAVALSPALKPAVPSRYATDFEQLDIIGQGGFGTVFKVRNKLDQRLYAIKKVQLDPLHPRYNAKIKREVTLLSRLDHHNVVRYYTSWEERSAAGKGSGSGTMSGSHDLISDSGSSDESESNEESFWAEWEHGRSGSADDDDATDIVFTPGLEGTPTTSDTPAASNSVSTSASFATVARTSSMSSDWLSETESHSNTPSKFRAGKSRSKHEERSPLVLCIQVRHATVLLEPTPFPLL